MTRSKRLTIPTFDFKNPGRNLFDFDEIFSKFDEFTTEVKFPKYNVLKYPSGNIELEIALAGYSKNNLSIELSPENVLTVATLSEDSDGENENTFEYITHGIASRNFKISWNVGDTLEVGDASFIDGMLRIPFKMKAPKKPKVKKLKIT